MGDGQHAQRRCLPFHTACGMNPGHSSDGHSRRLAMSKAASALPASKRHWRSAPSNISRHGGNHFRLIDANHRTTAPGRVLINRLAFSARSTSAIPPIAARKRTSQRRRSVPFPDSRAAANRNLYSINSSARSKNASGIFRLSALAVVRL